MHQSSVPIIKKISLYLAFCEVGKGLSPATIQNYHNFLKIFIRWLKEGRLEALKPHELAPEHIWNYRLYLSRRQDGRGRYIKKTTQNYYLIALRGLLSYFAERDIRSLPPEKIKLPKLTDKDHSLKFLSYTQVEKLLAMPDTATKEGLRDRAILEVLFSTGLRVAELVSLNMRLYDVKNIVAGKILNLEITITGKGGRSRTVYFSTRALKWLGAYLKKRQDDLCPPLFINYSRRRDKDDERRLTTRSIERIVRKYAARAGLPVDATPHTLRHSFATDLLAQGADMRSVQELLGHKNIMTTQIYTHVTNKKLKEVHKKFHRGNSEK